MLLSVMEYTAIEQILQKAEILNINDDVQAHPVLETLKMVKNEILNDCFTSQNQELEKIFLRKDLINIALSYGYNDIEAFLEESSSELKDYRFTKNQCVKAARIAFNLLNSSKDISINRILVCTKNLKFFKGHIVNVIEYLTGDFYIFNFSSSLNALDLRQPSLSKKIFNNGLRIDCLPFDRLNNVIYTKDLKFGLKLLSLYEGGDVDDWVEEILEI